MRLRSLVPVLASLLVAGACLRAGSVGFPPPVRPGVLSPTNATSTFQTLANLMESRGIPILMADTAFGVLRTDWVEWEASEIAIDDMADCGNGSESLPARTRARFSFEVRPRANRSFVSIISHWQMDKHQAFDESDRGYVDCRSTGEWERSIEEALTQRQIIR